MVKSGADTVPPRKCAEINRESVQVNQGCVLENEDDGSNINSKTNSN